MTGVCGGSPTQAWNCKGMPLSSSAPANMFPLELMMNIALVRSMSPVVWLPPPNNALPGSFLLCGVQLALLIGGPEDPLPLQVCGALFQPESAASTPPTTFQVPNGPMS